MSKLITQEFAPLYDHWNGTTQYVAGALRKYTTTGTTDANGNVTVYLTVDGTATGTALFSSIFNIQSIGVNSGANSLTVPNVYIKSVSTDLKTLVIGTQVGSAISLLGVLSVTAGGAGNALFVMVEGAK